MSDRKQYYFRQKVTNAELNDGFADLETGDRHMISDADASGIYFGFGAAQHAPTPDLTIDVGGPGAAYDADGERISFASLQNVDVSQDHSAVSTAVAGAGNEKYVSVFLKFQRVESDPRIDGYGATVYFEQDEGYLFYITQGAEAPAGTATPPALETDGVLVCDILMTFGMTQVLNANIETTRRQAVFQMDMTGRYAGLTLKGTAKDAVDTLVSWIDTHISGTGLKHYDEDIVCTALTGVPRSVAQLDVGGQLRQLLEWLNIAAAFAWAHVDTVGTIICSHNVASVVANGGGSYTVTMSQATPSSTYAVILGRHFFVTPQLTGYWAYVTDTIFNVYTRAGDVPADGPFSFAVFSVGTVS
jgi:hypothetical protein